MGVRGDVSRQCARCNLVADLHVTSSNSICSGRMCILYRKSVYYRRREQRRDKTVLAHTRNLYIYLGTCSTGSTAGVAAGRDLCRGHRGRVARAAGLRRRKSRVSEYA